MIQTSVFKKIWISNQQTEETFSLIQTTFFCFPECRLQNECIVTTDRDYLGNGNVDLFDALVIQIRFFLNDKGQKISEDCFAFHSSKKKDLLKRLQFVKNGSKINKLN